MQFLNEEQVKKELIKRRASNEDVNQYQIIQIRELLARYIDEKNPFESNHHPGAWKLKSIRTQLQDTPIKISKDKREATTIFNGKTFTVDLTTQEVMTAPEDTQ